MCFLVVLASLMIATPFIAAIGNVWIDRWFTRKFEMYEKLLGIIKIPKKQKAKNVESEA